MAECKYSTSIEPGPQIPSYAVRLRLFEVCLTLAKHLLPALLVLVVLAAPADAHQGGPDQPLRDSRARRSGSSRWRALRTGHGGPALFLVRLRPMR
jgi:hypothetical protein